MNIVVVGGGTGSSVVLEGLKKYKELSISVIVGMMDDGGSNATVRDEFGFSLLVMLGSQSSLFQIHIITKS